MSFNYDKNSGHGGGDSFWTSYSDLFLGLSTIFLMLYVISSLRTGTDNIKNMIENQNLKSQVQNLQTQLKMYESIKSDYLQNQAPQDEVKEYQELMDKLSLLQEEAKDENERLKQQAMEHASKQKALNKYQQMVRNVLNANKVAKTKIINRNDIIEDQDVEIETQDQEIGQLETDIQQKKRMIEQTEQKIADANEELERKIKEIERQRKQNKLNQKAYQAKMAKIKAENEEQIEALQDKAEDYEQQITQRQSQLNKLSGQLAATSGQLAATSSKLAAKEGEAQALQNKIAGLRGEYDKQAAADRAAFEAALAKEKLSGAERAAREGAFRAAAAAKEKELGDRIAGLSGDRAKARAEMDTRKQLAKDIAAALGRAGVKADVDMQTGDVLLDFGDAYFDSDSAKLKPKMKAVLEKAMPVYAKSLFGNPKVSGKISNVEVIGFASPTYKGRFVDPNSTNSEDLKAIKYNMDLSYRRANAIFGHVIEDGNMNFEHQPALVKKMKVSGRSFLEVFSNARNTASMQDFCKANDCRKAQRVVIRFSMDGKK